MGSKPKFWFRYQEEMWLFKQARPATGEHWAEKVASEIAVLLKLPTHEVKIACFEGKIGCAVRSFLNKGEVLVHGNELLAGAIQGYDKEKQRGQADHHFRNIVDAVERCFTNDSVREIMSLRLVGYFVLDALVGNTDRHHENWGVVLKPVLTPQLILQAKLAATFDHGSSLGRELREDRARQLAADPQAMRRYIHKATGGIFDNAQARKGLSPVALVGLIAANYPQLVTPWKKRISALPTDFARPLLAGISPSCMSQTHREFVLAFLAESRTIISSL